MADIVDAAQAAEEAYAREALSRRSTEIPHGVGLCLNCGAAVEGEKRWCDDECRDDYERFIYRRRG